MRAVLDTALQLKVEDAPQVEHERLQALIGWRVLSKRLEHLGWRLHTAPLRERLERPRRQSDERAGSRLRFERLSQR